MGSIAESTPSYSVPSEAHQVFEQGILNNPLIKPYLPADAANLASKIHFTGSDAPSIPINWRFAESISALKAYEALLVNALLKQRYGQKDPVEIEINTDHAQLFFMSALIWQLDPGDGKEGNLTLSSLSTKEGLERYSKLIKNCDLHRSTSSLHRVAATNIYKTKDDGFFHVHGSMNPEPTLNFLGLDLETSAATMEASWEPLQSAVSKYTRAELQSLADEHKQAGTICHTVQEFNASEHGRANAHVGLFEIHTHTSPSQPPSWWPETPSTSPARPLAGLKVVDLTRVIASPAVTRGLAELGASVMRITSPNVTDMSTLHLDLNQGKWNAHLDLKTAEGKTTLRELIADADVVVNGYRPFVYDKYGFGEAGILAIAAEETARRQGRGIIYARENCYGWNGPWKHRSGWQQISDACCGVSMSYGEAMLGHKEAVTPVFPNSDYCTGVAGVCGILTALLWRGEKGGSYTVDLALNYYSTWLTSSVGTYPEQVFRATMERNDNLTFRHHHGMSYTIPRMLAVLQKTAAKTLFNPDNFMTVEPKSLALAKEKSGGKEAGGGKPKIIAAKPILRFPGGEVKLGFNVGTRGNGVDQPRWPEDLGVEVVV